MNAKIIDGYIFANKIYQNIKKKIKFIKFNKLQPPGLGVILIGNDIISRIYINKKLDISKQLGFVSYDYYLPYNTKETTIINIIHSLNKDNNIHGILIQLPLPKHLCQTTIFNTIDPKKDIEGLNAYNIGRLYQRKPLFRSCTALGIIKLLKYYHINACGLHAVIVGASNIVGRPIALELLLLGCTVTITHRFTVNLKYHIKCADLLVVAIGKPNFISGKWIKYNAIVIDVGINRIDNKIVGDVDFITATSKASYITPVPGGIGPVTISMLMYNTLSAYESYNNNIHI
ncbi:bifunctional methylenetetrahydrofolate dehydrogenase/methenyltetrahydrofolate cyclohydrolase FolD [Enterobacteriaceae endosymbiont of Neohaemonia nigricornis]|uniref:bifunctional methylenetetrahydrofolate dehydrogenase/methenyltetrahydrofolate cyclohydrolase FolD n=1 Tax=Enterobacteriaceae endosymbiont of Neohaemonia nigricornis TaxID=2675792 RepID=UPI001448EA3A|nr:bifunctional methylenetetrahydrofolate dehydrogenase/methenyltetrahydrofolate cyclohydrolase FolD [Enterobacteriaceae endosymbiont of Neohaemonia nigricornis]QJC30226.1 bifunctional methylenetetrahydrofolate dehydrogenase/methenyltetrahydrofolate cyclohydrolase FolD [Enterobacteriaceae endosymbiont of Neohaemonia nigricornis]